MPADRPVIELIGCCEFELLLHSFDYSGLEVYLVIVS